MFVSKRVSAELELETGHKIGVHCEFDLTGYSQVRFYPEAMWAESSPDSVLKGLSSHADKI